MTFLVNAFAYSDLPFRIFLEENRHYRYYMLLAVNIAIWLLTVVTRRYMKHIPVPASMLLVNLILMTQAYTHGAQSTELGEPEGGPMNQLIFFGVFDAINSVFYLVPNPIFNKYGFLGWTLFAKICLFFWLITLYDNKVWAACVNFTITTVSQIMLSNTIERTLNDRYQLE